MRTKIGVVCINANGEPDLVIYEIDVSQEDVIQGNHYEQAVDQAKSEGYEAPFIPFDSSDPLYKKMST